MEPAALPVAEDAGEIENAGLPRRQQLLGGKFGRGVQVQGPHPQVGPGQRRFKGMQVGLVAGGYDQRPALHLGKFLGLEPATQRGLDRPPLAQQGPPVGMVFRLPPGHFDLSKPPCYSPPSKFQ